MAKQIAFETQIDIAIAVLNSNTTKKQIAADYGVSSDSVSRYANKHEDEARNIISKMADMTDESETTDEVENDTDKNDATKSMEEIMKTLNSNQQKILTDFYNKREENTDFVNRVGQRGRNPDGVKSIRQLIMEVIDTHFKEKTLLRENRQKIVKQIMDATGHNRVQSAKYFSGYKRLFGGYQDK
jgi:predicted transcriptional regulator